MEGGRGNQDRQIPMAMIKLSSLLKESFTEVHFVGTNVGADRDELIVHYDDNFDPIRAYVYRDSPLAKKLDPGEWEVPNPEELATYKWRWKRNPGSSFLYIDRNLGTFVWWITQLGYVELRDV